MKGFCNGGRCDGLLFELENTLAACEFFSNVRMWILGMR